MTLSGITVLLTRDAESNASVAALFEQRGARTLSLPTVELQDPDSWDECDRAIRSIYQYDGVFFTSKNAVERFLRRAKAIDDNSLAVLKKRSLYAVGEKTESALEEAGLPVTMTPDVNTAENLTQSLKPEEVSGKRFLFPKSAIARDILPNALRSLNAIVDEVVVYKNVPPSQKNLEGIRDALLHGEVDVVTFFSPSSVRTFHQMMGTKSLEHSTVAVIGPTTAAAATGLGISVNLIPPKATAEALVEMIENYHEGH
ncbi:MAG: uroporphyrinogen-III synthase [Bacteroidota bacterium]